MRDGRERGVVRPREDVGIANSREAVVWRRRQKALGATLAGSMVAAAAASCAGVVLIGVFGGSALTAVVSALTWSFVALAVGLGIGIIACDMMALWMVGLEEDRATEREAKGAVEELGRERIELGEGSALGVADQARAAKLYLEAEDLVRRRMWADAADKARAGCRLLSGGAW